MDHSSKTERTQFANDVLAGLSTTPKSLSSKYFYDNEGSRLFREIMKLPEYYLTNCEREIFATQTDAICQALSNGRGLDLIELGAGDGSKTALLIDHFLEQNADISYMPVDISAEAIEALTSQFEVRFPSLKITARQGDYFHVLDGLHYRSGIRKVLLFLGSNIGNFDHAGALSFFCHIRQRMNPDDLLFTGFDLQKDPHVIQRAYDDTRGVTADFNLNLLTRINRELGGNFDLGKFSHYAIYRPIAGSARSFLISRERQTVYIEALEQSFDFEQWEAIFMEISQKYTLKIIDELAEESGFLVRRNFLDNKAYFCDSLWSPR